MKAIFYFIFCLFFIFFSCSSSEAELNKWRSSWLGRSKDEVITKNGAPNRSAILTDGSEVLEYDKYGPSSGYFINNMYFSETASCHTRYIISPMQIVKYVEIWGDCVVKVNN